MASDVYVVVEVGVPCFADLGGDAGGTEEAILAGSRGVEVEAGAVASVEAGVDGAGAVEKFVLPEGADFRNDCHVLAHVPCVGHAGTECAAEASGTLSTHGEVEAFGSSFRKSVHAGVGVLRSKDRAEREAGSLPIVSEVDGAGELPAILVAARGAVYGAEINAAPDLVVAVAAADHAVCVEGAVGVGGVAAEEGAVDASASCGFVVGIGALVAAIESGGEVFAPPVVGADHDTTALEAVVWHLVDLRDLGEHAVALCPDAPAGIALGSDESLDSFAIGDGFSVLVVDEGFGVHAEGLVALDAEPHAT